jgi:hypothetical protein
MKDEQPSTVTLEGSEPQPDKWSEPDGNNEVMDNFSVYPGEGKTILED